MAVARRGSQQAIGHAASSSASFSVSFPADATAGDMVSVGVADFSDAVGPLSTGVTDNKGNSYTRDAIGSVNNGNAIASGLFSAMNIAAAAGTFTVTFTPSGNHDITLAISEYSGVDSTHAGALDVTAAGGSSVASTSYTTGTTAATAQADEVAIAMVTVTLNGGITTSSPFSLVGTDAVNLAAAMADRILSATGTQQCTWTGASDTWDACIATYKGAVTTTTDQTAAVGFLDPAPESLLGGPWLDSSPLPQVYGDTTVATVVDTNLQPAVVALVLSGIAPQLQETTSPTVGALILTGLVPVLDFKFTPAIASLVLAATTPTVTVNNIITPTIAALVLATISPQLRETTTPAIAALVLTGIAPQLRESLAPSTAALTLTGQTPSVVAGTVVQPTVAAITLTGLTAQLQETTTPTVAALVLTGQTPTANVGVNLQPAPLALTLTGATSTVTATANVTVQPGVAALTLTGIAPVVDTGAQPVLPGGGGTLRRGTWVRRAVPVRVAPQRASLVLRGLTPSILLSANARIFPRPAALALVGSEPAIEIALTEEGRLRREAELLLIL